MHKGTFPIRRGISFIYVEINAYFRYFSLQSVKFLREVTPYFRKASIISEVGWELQRAFLCPMSTTGPIGCGPGTSSTTSPPSAPRSPPRADTRYIPLQLTHLAKNLKYHDNGMYRPFYLLSIYVIKIERNSK